MKNSLPFLLSPTIVEPFYSVSSVFERKRAYAEGSKVVHPALCSRRLQRCSYCVEVQSPTNGYLCCCVIAKYLALHYMCPTRRSKPHLCCKYSITSTRTACRSSHNDGCYHVPRANAAAAAGSGGVGKAERESSLRFTSLHLKTVYRARVVTDLMQRATNSRKKIY